MSRSLQYWKGKRARSRLPRIRNNSKHPKTGLSNIIGFKVGMTTTMMIDDSEAVTKGAEVSQPATVLEIPKMEVYGIRAFKEQSGTHYRVSAYEIYDVPLSERLKIKQKKPRTIEELKSDKQISDISALVVAYPSSTSIGQKRRVRFESAISGKTYEEKVKFAESIIGKEVKGQEVFEEGEYIDTVSISKGKGWQGVIRRGGVRRNNHKSTQKIRHGGPLGAFTPGKVFYTIPRAGQLGFNYRTEQNKRILRISTGQHAGEINKKSGFKNYGNIKGDFIVLHGSVVGPAKRLVRIKKAIRNSNTKIIKPKLTGFS